MCSLVCELHLLRFTKDVALFSLTIITAGKNCFVVVMLVTSFSILDGTQEQGSISQPVSYTFNMEDCR